MTTRPTTRRAALGSVAGAVAGLAGLAGCDADSDGSSSPSRTPESSATPAADPDQAVVDEAVRELRSALALARSKPHSPARARLVRLHKAHLSALEVAPGPGRAGRTTDQELRAREQKLQRRLAELAVEADSGPLARLLASMSAGTAAHLAAGRRIAGGQESGA